MSSQRNRAKRAQKRAESVFGIGTTAFARSTPTYLSTVLATAPKVAIAPVSVPSAPAPKPYVAPTTVTQSPIATVAAKPVVLAPAPSTDMPIAPVADKPAYVAPTSVSIDPAPAVAPPVVTAYVAPVATPSAPIKSSSSLTAASPSPQKPSTDMAIVPAAPSVPTVYAEPERAYVPSSSSYSQPEPEPQYEVTWEPPGAGKPVSPSAKVAAPAPIASTAIVKVAPKPSLFARFLSWLGLMRKPAASAIAGDPPMSRSEAAGSLVRRARAGDQNAMAIIDMARQNAKRGNTQAKLAVASILDYIKRNPVPGAAFGSEHEPIPSVRAAVVRLANGPLLSKPRIRRALSYFGAEEEKEAFYHGYRNARVMPCLPETCRKKKAANAGKIVALARRLQAVRMPGKPVSQYEPMIGWELGE